MPLRTSADRRWKAGESESRFTWGRGPDGGTKPRKASPLTGGEFSPGGATSQLSSIGYVYRSTLQVGLCIYVVVVIY